MTSDLNWLDRAIAWVSPSRGAQRAVARLAYEAAKSERRTRGWSTAGTSADAEIVRDHGILRDRARSLVRDNPHAKKGVSVLVANRIGTGIMCQPAPARSDGKRVNQRKNTRLHERWKRWIDNCDVAGQLDFYGIQTLAERTKCEAGEALIRLVPTKSTGLMDVPFRLQVLEPDYLDTARDGKAPDSNNVIRFGVEYQGAVPVAYWIFDAHPGDSSAASLRFRRGGRTSFRVPRSEIIHYYKPLRAGQTRGITELHAVMLRLRALDDYDDAEVLRKHISACLAAFVSTPSGLPAAAISPVTTDADGRMVQQFNPGMVVHSPPGSSVQVADPKPSDGYGEFNSVQLHAVAAGLDMPYELLTGDFSQVNYSSFRGSMLQFKKALEVDQWQVTVPQLCRRVCERFTEEASGVDPMVDPATLWTFTPPRFEMLDPSKEVPSAIQAIQGGLMSYQNTVSGAGYEWRETLDEFEEFVQELDRRGITLTSDARKNAGPFSQRFEDKDQIQAGDTEKPKPEDDDAQAAA